MVGGSLRVLQLLLSLKLVTMILLKVALNTKNQSQSINLKNILQRAPPPHTHTYNNTKPMTPT
jgi:hypothetical protein